MMRVAVIAVALLALAGTHGGGLARAADVEIAVAAQPVPSLVAPAPDRGRVLNWRLGSGSNGLIQLAQALDVNVGLLIDRAEPHSERFTGELRGDTFKIVPDDRSLMSAWKGSGSIVGYGFYGPAPSRLALNVTYKNNLTTNLLIESAYLEIDESMVDRQPVLQLGYDGAEGDGPGLGTKFTLGNYGWGDPIGGRLEYGFVKPSEPSSTSRWSTPTTVPAIPERMGRSWNYDIDDALARLGVNTLQLRRWSRGACVDSRIRGIECRAVGDTQCLTELKRDGILGTLADAVTLEDGLLETSLIGRVSFRWKNSDGGVQSYSASFRQDVSMGFRSKRCGPAPPPVVVPPPELPSPPRIPVELQLDKRAYRIDLPVRGNIAAGGRGATRLLIRSPKSSGSKLRVVVTANGTVLRSKDIDLLMFVPRQ